MAQDDGIYYGRLIHAIEAMAKVLEDDSMVQLYKEQCKEMIRNFKHVGEVLDAEMNQDMREGGRFSPILKELYRQTFIANAVLESCCCNVKVQKDGRIVSYSWLQVAVTQSDEMIFEIIWDDLKWCFGLISIVGKQGGYSFTSTKLHDMDRSLIDADKENLKKKLEEILAGPDLPASANQERDRLLATYLKARLNNDEQHIFFANKCESDIVWSRKQTLNHLGLGVTATDWFGVRLARKVFNQPAELLGERQIMAPLNHPNVVRFISCSDREGDLAILMECVETNLEEYLKQRAKKYAAKPSGMLGKPPFNAGLKTLELLDIMYKIAFVMEYLHKRGVAHCDIKPLNLLVNPWKVTEFEGYVQLKIADFGVSKPGLNDSGAFRDSSKTSRGTTVYRAPELYGEAKNVDFKMADVFSYALTIWHIFHGEIPFADMPMISTLQEELSKGRRPVIDPLKVPEHLAKLIKECWKTDPQDRPTFSDVCIYLQRFKELQLGVDSPESISVPPNKTPRRWEVVQNAFQRAKTLAIQIQKCFSRPMDFPAYPGLCHNILYSAFIDCLKSSMVSSTTDFLRKTRTPPDWGHLWRFILTIVLPFLQVPMNNVKCDSSVLASAIAYKHEKVPKDASSFCLMLQGETFVKHGGIIERIICTCFN